MSGGADDAPFAWPFFYSYPPYFTKQPVRETADKQSSLWCSLILAWCKHNQVYIVTPSEDIPLWHNKDINRRLPPEAAASFLDELVAAGHAVWLDGPGGSSRGGGRGGGGSAHHGSSAAAGGGGPSSREAASGGSSSSSTASSRGRCLVLWRRLPEVAASISSWAAGAGVADSVMLLDELSSGPDVAGTELQGLHREVLVRALALLEAQGRVKLFRGAAPEEEGVKFL